MRRAVVQLARDAPPLVILQRQRAASETAEGLLGQPGLGDVMGSAEETRHRAVAAPREHRLTGHKPAPAAVAVAQPVLARGEITGAERAEPEAAAWARRSAGRNKAQSVAYPASSRGHRRATAAAM
jgi:hypothetical protein